MPQLEVPLIRQPPDTGECGLACLAMIYGFYGVPVTYDDVREQVALIPTGVDEPYNGLSMPLIGKHLQLQGLETNLIIANPRLFCGTDIDASPKKVREILAGQKVEAKNESELRLLNYLDDYLDHGGQIEVSIPTKQHIMREVDAGHPLISIGTTRFMAGIRNMNFHFTVVTGYTNTEILMNDPGSNRDGKLAHPQDWWFHSLIASTYADWDNGSLLCIRPKTKGQKNDLSLQP